MSLSTYLPVLFFFFNDTATTEIYTLSLHDALPILSRQLGGLRRSELGRDDRSAQRGFSKRGCLWCRSEEHTSELQSLTNLVCRLLLEKKKTRTRSLTTKRCYRPWKSEMHHDAST